MTKNCPQCETSADLSKVNKFRPFCSERCKLIDLGAWANEEKLISRPMESEDFYDD
ncbi:DNA gyrase inhibitor YacG [Gammaproteobacteria bacterium]|nr:DNA gyrase inhibitor YacG [Gammaproteobacteria bacterium]